MGWTTLQWLKHERPGLLMVHEGPGLPFVAPPLGSDIELRSWEPGDDAGWIALLNANGSFGSWDLDRLATETAGLIKEGQYFAVSAGKLAAGAGVLERPLSGQPALEIGWVVRHPEFKRKGLGLSVTLAALDYALNTAANRTVYLYTDDHRLTAISMYLDLGFQPRIRSHRSYAKRWDKVFRDLAARNESGLTEAASEP